MAQNYMAVAKFFFEADDGLTDAEADQWAAQATADFKDQTKQMADVARVHKPGTEAEETTYVANFRVADDGSLTTVDAWHLDTDGTLKEGLPE